MSLKIYNLGDFRAFTKDMPDDTELAIQDADISDVIGYYELQCTGPTYLPPVGVLGHPGILLLDGGQHITLEKDLEHRIDVYLGD